MRNYLLAAVAAAALTTPALARDKSVYVGVDAGVMLVEDTNLDFNYDYDARLHATTSTTRIAIDHNLGFDVDLVAGYDFGLVRGEVELGYKRASTRRSSGQFRPDRIRYGRAGYQSDRAVRRRR